MTGLTRRVLALALVLVASLALVACGGDDGGGSGDTLSKEDYAKQLTDTVKPVGERLSSIGTSIQGGSPEEAVGKLDEVKQELDDVAAKVEDLNPPEEVQAEHDAYVEKLKALSGDVDELKSAVESKDQQKAVEAAQKLTQDGQAVTEAEQAISQKLNE